MEKKNLALYIIGICLLSLIAGMFLPNKTEQVEQPKTNTVKTNFINNIDTTGDKIALLNIDGVIASTSSRNYWSQEFNPNLFIDSLRNAVKDSKVKAIIIRVNSPGGTVAASQDIYDEIMRVRGKKPVIVSMADVAASGGYYVSSAADRIVAQKGTMTGSIGVIMNFTDIAKLSEKIGIADNTIKSGRFKDSGSMYRKMDKDEQELFQSSVNTAYKQFTQAITEGRINRNDKYQPSRKNLTKENLAKYADGRVFLGEEAYKLGFVDEIGSLYEAKIIATQMAGSSKELPLVDYNKTNGFQNFLMSLEGKIKNPLKDALPFSYSHSSIPLMIWE